MCLQKYLCCLGPELILTRCNEFFEQIACDSMHHLFNDPLRSHPRYHAAQNEFGGVMHAGNRPPSESRISIERSPDLSPGFAR